MQRTIGSTYTVAYEPMFGENGATSFRNFTYRVLDDAGNVELVGIKEEPIGGYAMSNHELTALRNVSIGWIPDYDRYRTI